MGSRKVEHDAGIVTQRFVFLFLENPVVGWDTEIRVREAGNEPHFSYGAAVS